MRSRKGQLADVLQWVPATIIIFLIIIVFLLLAGLLTGTKLIGKGKDVINTNVDGSSLIVYSELRSFLEANVSKEKVMEEGVFVSSNRIMKDEIFLWAKGKLTNEKLKLFVDDWLKDSPINGNLVIGVEKKGVEKKGFVFGTSKGKIEGEAEIKIPFEDFVIFVGFEK